MFGFRKKEYDKSTEELLSIVIPLYNHEKYIKEAIDSVIKQTYQNWELIIIDDGSKDKSVEIAKSYNDNRIQVYVQENAGAHNAINRGLSLAKGKYLAVLNSDDAFEKERFDVMIREMENNPQIEFMCSYIYVVDDKGKRLGVKEGWNNMEPWMVSHPEKTYKITNNFKFNLLMNNFTSTTSNFLFTRKLYEKIGGMRNLRFAHDWDFALRAAEITECKIIERPLMRYRVHPSNTISSNRKWMLFEIAWIWAANLSRFYNDLFRCEDIKSDIKRLMESIYLQGNDKVFWSILVFIQAQEAKGVEKPEELLLNDDELRDVFLEYVVE